MIWLINSVREAGWFGYAGICLGLLGVPLGLACLGSLLAKRRGLPLGLGAVAVLFAMLTFGLGVVGYFVSMYQVETALLGLDIADPAHYAQLHAAGVAEAISSPVIGGLGAVFPFVAGLVACVRGALMKGE